MRRLLAMLALGLGAALQAAGQGGSLDAFVDAEMRSSSVPGIAYAVVEDGRIAAVGARGVVMKGGDEKVTPDTPFLIASISKSFTALAVMQLVEAGKVDLDAGIGRYLKTFAGKPAGSITIRQLLSHTSGYSTMQGNARPEEVRAGADAIARSAKWYADEGPANAPGSAWQYSNANYLILGRLIEVVSGQPYPDYIQASILDPIGMTHSFVAGGGRSLPMARGHTPWFGSMRPIGETWMGPGSAPQGGIVSSASDLARYLQMMMNGKDDIISRAGKQEMMQAAGPASPAYGFGWNVDAGEGSVYHNGNSPGFDSVAAMIPSQQRAVVVLANSTSGMGFGESTVLRYGIVARALGLPEPVDSGKLWRKATFLALAIAPPIFLACILWAWRKREALRAKSGISGRFSLWFPLLAMIALAWACLWLVPMLFGAPLATLRLFQPDMTLLLEATALLGVVWAVFRLGVAYTGRGNPAR